MSEWAAKRFWKDAAVVATDAGFSVELDGRSVKTPAKTLLEVPTKALADAIKVEWDAQSDKIDPMTMPVTRSANSALDKVRHQRHDVADMLAAYGDSDLICYRADRPVELVARQSDAWDPLIDFADQKLGAKLATRFGVMHEPQSEAAQQQLSLHTHAFGDFELAAFHDLVALSGSLVIGFAAIHQSQPIEDLWKLSRIDEDWQIEQWGEDDEAAKQAEIKRQAFLHAERFYRFTVS
jgi:chaperone required for assembly of F1-ATPase